MKEGLVLDKVVLLGRTLEEDLIDSRAIGVDLAATLNRITRPTSFESGGIKI
jgi:hypothetical protein